MPDEEYEGYTEESEESEGQSDEGSENNGNGQSDINTSVTRPFVATVSPQYNYSLDYDKIKAARISAMAFYGGELFDVSHMKRTYENPYLSKLVKDCNSANMPFMLYVTSRARNITEADDECRALYYVISQFPPQLGLWINIETNNSVSVNDDIVEVYYKYAEKWGISSRLGLYLDYNRLSCITWTQFQDRFYLWLIAPTDVNTVDDELLKPELFEVP